MAIVAEIAEPVGPRPGVASASERLFKKLFCEELPSPIHTEMAEPVAQMITRTACAADKVLGVERLRGLSLSAATFAASTTTNTSVLALKSATTTSRSRWASPTREPGDAARRSR